AAPPAADPQAGAAPIPAPPPEPVYRPALLVTEPVRSGQQIYAEKTDLVITAPVSPGAEVVADGNIHVYGALRGRALAGVSGDASSVTAWRPRSSRWPGCTASARISGTTC
ncbi:septum site-determining protein MinC, partial [Azospirillum brasilense]|uniref:septum site-determining protein MinC n=1 Tax=Azospirillum brasilense TaxID=192 RepID=UPI001FFF4392